MFGVAMLMMATTLAAWWMAGQQDRLADATSRRMVEGGIEAVVDRSRTMVLDYAVWTDAYDHIMADDLGWMAENIGASTKTNAFDAVVILRSDGPPLLWQNGDAEAGPALVPEDVRQASALLNSVPIDSGAAVTTFVRSAGTSWLVAAARVIPQDGLPPAVADADLPRLLIAFRVGPEMLSAIARRFLIADLTVDTSVRADRDALPLPGPDREAEAFISWTPPTPGRAVLRAILWPLLGLMVAVGAIVILVARELVRSARKIEGALAQAYAADRAKTVFLSNVSHELRTPLNGIIGVGQLMQMRPLDPEMTEMVNILLASARSQLQLVNGLLDITRIESGALTLEKAPFDAAAVLEDTVQLMAPIIAGKGLSLDVQIDPSARRLTLGDKLAFRQIATNLIGNAAKFTSEGTIAVALRSGPDGVLVLSVRDTGEGIDPVDHERIFDRFVQIESGSKREGGTGLGLAITRALIDLMGGTVTVESALGQGATFTVTLPLPAAGELATAA